MTADDHDDSSTETLPNAPETHELSLSNAALDRAFSALSNRRRRAAVAFLLATDDGVATVDDLAAIAADAMAATDTAGTTTPADAESSERRRRVAVTLRHAHLPALDRAGVVDYDARSETVRYRGTRALRTVLDRTADPIVTGPSPSTWCDLLADRRRRYALRVLSARGGALALSDLATEVAAREYGTRSVDASSNVVERVHASLYHDHVPRLADAGVVSHDQDRDTVAPSGGAAELGRHLDDVGIA